jgi:hypothetical protein
MVGSATDKSGPVLDLLRGFAVIHGTVTALPTGAALTPTPVSPRHTSDSTKTDRPRPERRL